MIITDNVIPGHIDACPVFCFALIADFGDALITVYDRKVFVSEIGVIVIEKKIVLSRDRKVSDTIAV